MKMLNGEISAFVEYLMGMELNAKQSRMRTRFCKVATEQIKQIEDERIELVKEFSNKDADGNPKIMEVNGQQQYDVTNLEAFNKEYQIMLVEEFVLDNTEERKEMLLTIRDIVENVEGTFSRTEAFVYDRWCEIVESITY